MNEEIKQYKGYQCFCVEGAALWLFITLPLLIIIHSIIFWDKWPLIGAVVFCLAYFSLFFWRLYYFQLTEDRLIIRLHNIPWFKKTYYLKDIQKITFETKFKMPVCLRVFTGMDESKLYPAATLWNKTWAQLQQDLEEKNVSAQNECVRYQPKESSL